MRGSALQVSKKLHRTRRILRESRLSSRRNWSESSLLQKGFFFQLNGKCYKPAQLGDDCEVTEQCKSGSLCLEGICKCPEGHAPFKERCLANLCGLNRHPILDTTGNITLCMGASKCVRPAVCNFSKNINSYLCCSPVNQVLPPQPRVIQTTTVPRTKSPTPRSGAGFCPGGKTPLYFPNTQVCLWAIVLEIKLPVAYKDVCDLRKLL